MKTSFSLGINTSFLVVIFFMVLSTCWSLSVMPNHDTMVNLQEEKAAVGDKEKGANGDMAKNLYPTGSTLPDCSHACGPCFPCKRVMVSFKCSMAESCPIVYRCMCKGKYYHVPSN
ncbi:hypothetical protein L6164_022825 [Bauhinia variegata]|uniref:Uncharacterized protein n=1 Tax=Bauhinia variegata TaxID=167791 RepID=A0ACB9MGW0_BAUVA|nr:hypothetical protein L6164_022825 [Bauhinia variegata]